MVFQKINNKWIQIVIPIPWAAAADRDLIFFRIDLRESIAIIY
jgi:hypothetical protein